MNIIKSWSNYGGGRQVPDRLVIHAMGQTIDDGEKIYTAKKWLDKLGYSVHYLVHPDGSVQQCREENEIAYHAKGFNTGSVGIEVLVSGTHNYGTFKETIKSEWVSDEQLNATIELSKGIIERWLISESRINRHSDLDSPRKVDPGVGFPWDEFLSKL